MADRDAGKQLGLEEGLLCQLLHSPAYNLFPKSAVFESNFVQVTKKGKQVDITNMPIHVTLGVTSSDPCLPLPNVLFMARGKMLGKDHPAAADLSFVDLSRMLPLRSVRLAVHSASQRILSLKTVTKKVYYLQLCQEHPDAVFRLWTRLVDILQSGLSITSKDSSIRIRHSLVSSGSSPSSGSSVELCLDAEPQNPNVVRRAGKKLSGVFSQLSGKDPRNQKSMSRKRVSFEDVPAINKADVHRDVLASSLGTDVEGLLYDPPPPLRKAPSSSREGSQTAGLDMA